MPTITATSWDGTQFYFNWDKSTFVSFENADLENSTFACDESDIDNAKECAKREDLKLCTVQLEIIEIEKSKPGNIEWLRANRQYINLRAIETAIGCASSDLIHILNRTPRRKNWLTPAQSDKLDEIIEKLGIRRV